ncbi:hypothetical protein [Hyphomonas sp. GM-8P]|uniref:hypothetical protein n=1 Tax=Hyphomonas sp. GM-8P TaxID=1280945 RepID=UPI000DC02133|nr:hypothetical protein [Hyphomonas sp. GM-8P]RAN40412.1 hypothetical protein HY26_01490 [Hyphomonas sp. GM-8P]
MKNAIGSFAALVLAFAPAAAADLRPDQKVLVEKLLAGMDPSMREPMRPQIEQSIIMMTPEQTAAVMAGMVDDSTYDAGTEPEEEEGDEIASPEDLAYNRAQFEPVIRANWQAQKDFDNFTDAVLKEKCPDRETYAVFGSGYRFEFRRLAPNWPRASSNVDSDVQILSGSYAPQDGRYDFDFSKVKTSFDKAAVASAIARACADWTKEAAVFQTKAHALVAASDFDGAFNLEQASSGKVTAIETPLETTLNAQAPAADNALYTAFLNGRRVK